MVYRLIIAGSRGFVDYELMKGVCDKLFKKKPFTVISGGARGADKLAERYAKEKGIDCRVIEADWGRLGKKAGYLRNKVMREEGQALLAFWDGQSRGTSHMIDLCMIEGLPVKICYYKERRVTAWK